MTSIIKLFWSILGYGDTNCDNHETHPPVEHFPYKRQNHFKQYLQKLQAKPISVTSEVPDFVIDLIRKECSMLKLKDRDILTPAFIRRILKKNNLNKYYEQTYYIIKHLGGQIIELTDEQETIMVEQYTQLSNAFDELQPEFKPRLCFLSAAYLFQKLAQRNKITIPTRIQNDLTLKSMEKLVASERIYKRLCEHLGWDFIPVEILV